MIQSIVNLLPASWQYPNVTCARILLEGKVSQTANFAGGVDKQASAIHVHGKKVGVLEVHYLEKMPKSDEGPFLKWERSLLDAIAERIGKIVEHKKAEAELRLSHQKLRELYEHLQTAREGEQKRIAYEIHDDLGQILTALKMDVRWLSRELSDSTKAVRSRTHSMTELVDNAFRTVHEIASELRPTLLDDFGLSAQVLHHAEEFQKRSGVKCSVRIRPNEIVLDQERSVLAFRVFQELLTNVLRHSDAAKVNVSLVKSKAELKLEVRDNGKGIARGKISDRNSFGLRGIMERVTFWRGQVVIRGAPHKGTKVVVRLPLNRRGETP
ncbi:MAG: sensor histidine kinase [Elusimicrobia bacterium]|nr:sensor histidine kinase [Elusimicrobiota bacterium]